MTSFMHHVLTVFPSDVESLKNGFVKTSKNKANAPYTIFLVGDTGVGKTSLMELIANVLQGQSIDHYNFNIVDHSHGQDGPDNQSQAKEARVNEFTSKNGIVVSASALTRWVYITSPQDSHP